MTNYQAWFLTKYNGKDDWNTNALVFKTKQEAEDYAKDLFSRWTLPEGYEIRETSLAATHTFTEKAAADGSSRLINIPSVVKAVDP